MKFVPTDRALGAIVSKAGLGGLAVKRANRFAALLARSGQTGNPILLASRSIGTSLFFGLLFAPASLVASLYLWPPCGLLVLAPLVEYSLPELRLRDRASQRKEGVEKELPFFSVLVNVLGSAGVSLYAIFDSLATNDVFDSMKIEALLFKRDVTVFGMNPNDSFERLASSHPSRRFADFLYGYTSKVRSGGDLPTYLAGESGSLLRQLEEGWSRYASRVGIIGSMMITFFGVIPLLLMVVGIFTPGFSIVGLAVFSAVGVPLFTVLLIYLAGRMQPVGEEPLRGKAKRSALLAVPVFAGFLLFREVWAATAAFLIVFFVAYGLSVRKQVRETREIDEGLVSFMKDMMEFKRQEYDLTRAVLSIASNNRYNRSFDRLVSGVATRLKAGIPLDEIELTVRSRLARLAFFLIGQMSRSGGGTVDTVYQLSNYTGRLVEMKKNARAEMRPYLALSYASPLLLAFGVNFVGGVLGSFGDRVRPGLANLSASGILVGQVPPALSEVSNVLIVVSAAALGLIGAKITDLTVRNTLGASLNVGIAVAALISMSVLSLHSLL